jgi:fatty-acyl-CoA synthase
MAAAAGADIFEQHLGKSAANYVPLTPISFLLRSAAVYPEKTAVVHGDRRYSYREFKERCCRFASALAKRGIGKGDSVAILAANSPPLLEAHYAVPMTGAVLNALNTRSDAATIAFILQHGEAKLLIADSEYHETIGKALASMEAPPPVVDFVDSEGEGGERLGSLDYDAFLTEGDPGFQGERPADEWQALALNYTSGTTGNPKGVVYHHRGAYLNALGNLVAFGLTPDTVYLWTLPMFHCNGWTYTWAVTAAGGTHVCLRKVDPALIYPLIAKETVTHMCGAPIVLNMLAHAPDDLKKLFSHRVRIATGGAAPPSAVIERMGSAGFDVLHLYGLTECYGPATLCAWQEEWNGLEQRSKAEKMARQGVKHVTLEEALVIDPDSMQPVPWDGRTMGEIMLRSNTVMKGYLKNPEATETALAEGWFHTGDLGVQHPDGYIEVKDRAKDIIISGGENISSLEVEEALYRHPKVLEAAVVSKPDEKWGETPCAFVTLQNGASADAQEIIDYCREVLATYKAPRHIVFGPLPKTSTGKIQKFELREKAKAL